MMPALTSQETKQLLAFQTMKSPNTISTINYHFYKKMKITAGY